MVLISIQSKGACANCPSPVLCVLVKTCKNSQDTKGKSGFFLPVWNRPIIFRKMLHEISILTKKGTHILKSVSKEGLMTS